MVDSTNRVALDLARAGAPGGVVVVAGHQTAGRGRHGRTWDAAPGSSLLLSVLHRPGPALPPDRSSRPDPALPSDRSHLAVAAVSLAARQACWSAAGFTPALKWPNDLVVGDAKLAGVLAEVAGDAVVVGLGLNVSLAGPWPA
ncbi:MAG: biotin--[acetyl-CoA-carboxylase] ligase, partial [Acidimicrobiales bacterium]